MFAYCENNPICNVDPNGCIASEAIGASALAYFLEYVLPEIIVGGLLILTGVLIVYLIAKVVADAIEANGSSSIATPPPKRNDEAEDAWDKIPNALKNGEKVDISKFDTQLKNGQGKRASNGWRIEKDTSGHKGSVWKLFNKKNERIASLKGDGTVVGK